jgi:hypothetical protein
MEFQLDDKASFNPRFVAMVSELWDNGGKIMLNYDSTLEFEYTVFQSKGPLLDIRFASMLGLKYYRIDIVFMGFQTDATCEFFEDTNMTINDLIRRIYEKYATIDALEYPIYQMLECYLVGTIYQTTLSWRNISLSIGANKFTLTHNDETYIDEFECNPKYYARQLMQAMRDGTAHEIFYAGLPKMKSARRS